MMLSMLNRLRIFGLNVIFLLYLILVALDVHLVGAQSVNELNPLKANTISELLSLIIDAAILILMPLVVLAIIYSGFMFLIAQGNEEKLKTAKNNFLWVIVGVAVLLGAKVISAVLKATAKTIVN